MTFIKRHCQKFVYDIDDIDQNMECTMRRKCKKNLRKENTRKDELPVGHQLKRTQSSEHSIKSQASSIQGFFDKYMSILNSNPDNKSGDIKRLKPHQISSKLHQGLGSTTTRKSRAINTLRVAASKPRQPAATLASNCFSIRPTSKDDERPQTGFRKVVDYKPCTKTTISQGGYPATNMVFQCKTHLDVPNWHKVPPECKGNYKHSPRQNRRRSDSKIRTTGTTSEKHLLNVSHQKFVDKTSNAGDHTRSKSHRRCVACEVLAKKPAVRNKTNEKSFSSLTVEPKKSKDDLICNDPIKIAKEKYFNSIYYGTSRIMTSSERVHEWLDAIPIRESYSARGDSQQPAGNIKEKTETVKPKKLNERAEGSKKCNIGLHRVLGKGHSRFEVALNIEVPKERRYRTRKKDKLGLSIGS